MIKIYSKENSIVIEDEKNDSTVQIDFYFEPLISFNNFYDYTFDEEIELLSKDITIEINNAFFIIICFYY